MKDRSTQLQVTDEIREILSLKAQGWSDDLIRRQLGLRPKQYEQRKKKIRESEHFQREALEFASESIHRLRYLRLKAFEDYHECKKKNLYNASAAAFRRMVEIDTAIPKLCSELGWSVGELQRYFNDETVKKELQGATEDELFREYRNIVKPVSG